MMQDVCSQRGEDLSRNSNNIESVGLRICPYDHYLTNKLHLSDATITNVPKSFIYKLAAKKADTDIEKLRHYHTMYKLSGR